MRRTLRNKCEFRFGTYLELSHLSQNPPSIKFMRTRTELMKELAQAKRHIERGDSVIASQRQLVAKLSGDGHDTMQAKRLLRSFEESQKIRLDDMDRMLDALNAMP